MARIHYEVDGDIPPERFVGALTDFSDDRPALWPNLSAEFYAVHDRGDTWADVTEGTDVAGGVWGRERYDWSEPGIVRLTLVESPSFVPRTVIEYRVSGLPDGRCRVSVDFHRIARGWRGRLVGVVVQLAGARRFSGDLRETLARLGSPAAAA